MSYEICRIQCNAEGIDSKIHSARNIPFQYHLNFCRYWTSYWTCTRSNNWLTSKLHTGAESNQNRRNVELLSNLDILLRLVLCHEKVAIHTSGESSGLYISFLCTLTVNSNYPFFVHKLLPSHHPSILLL